MSKNVTVQIVALKDIRPNPFRYITDYPLSETKVAELAQSIADTGFWTNVCARPVNDKYEIAYGHHRVEAAKRAGLKEVPLVIERDMDDERAFAMMTRENSESYGVAAYADAGVVAGLISGYVDRRLVLDAVHAETPTRTVYLATKQNGKLRIIGPGGKEVEEARSDVTRPTFTVLTLAKHLHWTKGQPADLRASDRFYAAFNALAHLILPGAVAPKDLEGLPQKTVMTIAAATKEQGDKVAKQRSHAAFVASHAPNAQAKLAAERESTRLGAEEERVRRDAAQRAIRAAQDEEAAREEKARIKRAASKAAPPAPKNLPTIERYAERLIERCRTMEDPYERVLEEARRMIPHLDDMDAVLTEKVAKALEQMVERSARKVSGLAEAFRSNNRRRITALLA